MVSARLRGYSCGTAPVLTPPIRCSQLPSLSAAAPRNHPTRRSVFAVTSAMIGLGYGSYPPVTYMEAQLWIAEMIVMAA